VVTAELTKIRTVRSTKWALLLTLLICVFLGYAVCISLRQGFPRLPPRQRREFDPLFATFYSLSIGQLALVVFGVTVTGGEYSTGMIAASLTAVPRRSLFYAAKITAGLLVAAGTAILRSPAMALALLMPLLFLDSQGLGNVPGLQKFTDYLPDQAGAVIAHLSGTGTGHFSRPFGPWTGMAIMLAWTAAALACGYLVLARTDASGDGVRVTLRRNGTEDG
jgi:ABC-2 type transport system permease protein